MGSDTYSKLYLEFDNNQLAQELFGIHENHLKALEKELDIQIFSRGSQLKIVGEKPAIDLAKQALEKIYERLLNHQKFEKNDLLKILYSDEDTFSYKDKKLTTKRRTILPRSPLQAEYIQLMKENELVFSVGPAGTGKTYLAVAAGVEMMLAGKIDRLVLSRPAVEAGERLGFLPGDLKEKIDPYLRPLYDALFDMLPADLVNKKIAVGEIEIAPLAFMRGRTLSDSFVILDEAQNTTSVQMKMFLTRLGNNSRMIVTGDMTQVDLPQGIKSGLQDAIETLQGVNSIGFVNFTEKDVVRHPLVAKIVEAYGRKKTSH